MPHHFPTAGCYEPVCGDICPEDCSGCGDGHETTNCPNCPNGVFCDTKVEQCVEPASGCKCIPQCVGTCPSSCDPNSDPQDPPGCTLACIPVTGVDKEGCSPGYFKNPGFCCAWAVNPTEKFCETIFGYLPQEGDCLYDICKDFTNADAISCTGKCTFQLTGANAPNFVRQGLTAYLNALNPAINYAASCLTASAPAEGWTDFGVKTTMKAALLAYCEEDPVDSGAADHITDLGEEWATCNHGPGFDCPCNAGCSNYDVCDTAVSKVWDAGACLVQSGQTGRTTATVPVTREGGSATTPTTRTAMRGDDGPPAATFTGGMRDTIARARASMAGVVGGG
eukprot:9485156-Pyramimonas_sp.AAC.3